MIRQNFSISDFYCSKCGKRGISIPRKHGQSREKGHIKDLYCIYCNTVTKHIEISNSYTYYDFIEDFNNGLIQEVVNNNE